MQKVRTFRSKVLCMVIVTVLSTALTIQFFAQWETEKAMSTTLEENARNLLDTVVLIVENQFQSMLFHESAILAGKKRDLRNWVANGLREIEKCHRLFKEGRLSEREAKARALEEVREIRYDEGVGYLWINNCEEPVPRMLMHPTMPELEGQVMDDPRFKCVIGSQENLFITFVRACGETGSGYVDYLWPKPIKEGLTAELPKISYVLRFPQWDWIVGSGVYVNDIEEEKRKRFDAVIADLGRTCGKVRIARTGYFFIFDKNRKIQVHPVARRGEDTGGWINPETRGKLFDELIAAAAHPDRPFEYVWDRPDRKGDFRYPKKAYVRHFAPLDWYICSTFYQEEIVAPAAKLRSKVLVLSLGILAATILATVLLSNNLIRPLKELVQAARGVEREGVHGKLMPVSGTQETMELGTVLNNMIGSLRESERELRRANDYIGSVINSMPSILVGVDSRGLITHWNAAAGRAAGRDGESVVGCPVEEVLPSLVPEMEAIRQAIRKGRVLSRHRRPRSAAGQVIYEDITLFPLVSSPEEGAVIRIDDVSDRVRMEEMMIQNEKMLSLGGLAAGMAHEINNPLAGMMQTASVMANRLGREAELPANREAAEKAGTTMEAILCFMDIRKIPRMLTSINESGHRLVALVNNMLSFARKSDARKLTCSMAELLDQTLELAGTDYDLKKQYDFRMIRITREYDSDLPDVPCERDKIQQVLLNILRNGAQAMQGAAVPDPTFLVRTSYDMGRDMACIEIMDNGPGMDEATRKRIFEPFFTTRSAGEGTGLGLSVSFFIISEIHGGELGVESCPGTGSRFIIRLPLQVKGLALGRSG